jgi:hypothetical protein
MEYGSSYWIIHRASAPTLQTLALKILTQPSSSTCEKNWSIFSFIYSLRRNKITSQRAEDLVYVRSDLRLFYRGEAHNIVAGRLRCGYFGRPQFGSLEDVRMLEVPKLSLDEPQDGGCSLYR